MSPIYVNAQAIPLLKEKRVTVNQNTADYDSISDGDVTAMNVVMPCCLSKMRM